MTHSIEINRILILCYFFLVGGVGTGSAQPTCIPFKDIFSSVMNLNFNEPLYLSYDTCSDFDFVQFKPLKKTVKAERFFVIGYDTKKAIREVILHMPPLSLTLKMVVYDFKEYRILINKVLAEAIPNVHPKEFKFLSTLFLVFKDQLEVGQSCYMITVVPQFDVDKEPPFESYYDSFPISSFANISCIMSLDSALYPKNIYRLSRGAIFWQSSVIYEPNSRIVDRELVEMFLNTHAKPKLQMDAKKCLVTLFNHNVESDVSLQLHPRISRGFPETPLWLFRGDHGFKP